MGGAYLFTLEEAQREIAEVENALYDGYTPSPLHGNNRQLGAVTEAANRLSSQDFYVGREGLAARVGTIGRPQVSRHYRHHKLTVDWGMYRPSQEPDERAQDVISAPNIGPERRYTLLADENRELRRQLKEAHRSANTDEIIREIIGDFSNTSRNIPDWLTNPPKRERHKPVPEVPVGAWSDWHLGEVVEKAEVNGFNSFNMSVAEERVERLIETTIRLCEENHTGVYAGFVLNLLGDFVSGGIHPELKATDEDEVIPSSLKASDWLVGGLERIGQRFKKVYVACACGNHGRNTFKPEFKRYYRKNFDWLILQIVARHFHGNKRFHFDIRPSNDVHYRVWNERYLACHGDMLGVRGGDGFVGAIGPIVRGEIKQAGQSSALGLGYDHLLMGHWHQRLWLPRATVNNTLKGFDEFAMKGLGSKPDRPTQALWFVHPSHGKTAHWDIFVDDKPASATEWVSWKNEIE